MKLYVRLHNSVAVTGLLRYINLSLWHIHSGGQISWSWPWSSGFINHNLMRQKWCHRARWSIYISITARTRLKWPLMADVIDHTQQYCNTKWDLVRIWKTNRKLTRFAALLYYCLRTQVVTPWEKLLSTRWRYFLQAGAKKTVTQIWRQQDEFSRSSKNNDHAPDLSGPGEVVLAFPADFLYEINSFMAIGV